MIRTSNRKTYLIGFVVARGRRLLKFFRDFVSEFLQLDEKTKNRERDLHKETATIKMSSNKAQAKEGRREAGCSERKREM